MTKYKEPIRLRQRKTPKGLMSLYLDVYFKGKRTYEYLKLYLVPEKSKADKEHNRKTLEFAEAIKAKRLVELRNGEYGFQTEFATNTLFFEYYRRMCQKRLGQESKSNWGNWYSCLKHLLIYEKRHNITFAQITTQWIEGFKNYLDNTAVAWQDDKRKRLNQTPLSRNTKLSYFNKLRACINKAFEERIIKINPMQGVENFKAEEGQRMYLTLEELKELQNTPCDYPIIKNAFLFSCLTGLRRGDVIRLCWGDVYEDGLHTRIIFKQQKTKGQEYLDINAQARQLMGQRGKPNDKVFPNILSPTSTNNIIQNWVYRAGINKKITFHCGRHTFATLLLTLGTDIYTVSKLLGHRVLTTTQIYAKIIDKRKQEAVDNIPQIL